MKFLKIDQNQFYLIEQASGILQIILLIIVYAWFLNKTIANINKLTNEQFISFFYWPLTDSQERPQDLASIVIGGGRPLPPKIRSNLSGCSIDCFFFLLRKYFQITKMKYKMNLMKVFGCFLFLICLYKPISFPYCFFVFLCT